MTELADMIRIGIVNGDVARIQNGRGVMLSVQHGTVWITQTDSVADVFLNAGESFRLDRDGRTLVSRCGPEPLALVTLASSSRTAPLAKRVAAGLRRMWTGLRRVPWRASLNWPAESELCATMPNPEFSISRDSYLDRGRMRPAYLVV